MKEIVEYGSAAANIEPHVAKKVAKVDPTEEVLCRKAGHAGKALLVVLATLVRVGKDRVGLGDFLVALLGLWGFIAIRMILESQLAKGIPDRGFIRVPLETEYGWLACACAPSAWA